MFFSEELSDLKVLFKSYVLNKEHFLLVFYGIFIDGRIGTCNWNVQTFN